MTLSLILVSHLRLDCSRVSGIHRNIDSNKRVDIPNNMQAAIVKKNYPTNIQYNSQTNRQWYCLISPVLQIVFDWVSYYKH